MSETSPAPGLLRSRFDTRCLPQQIARAAWHESINVVFDSSSRRTIEDGFYASVDAVMMGEVALGRISGTAQDFDRSRYKIARDSMDGYILQFYLNGQSAARNDGNLPVAGQGDLYVLDMAQPLATSTTDHDQISFIVPRRLLAPKVDHSDNLHQRVIPAATPLVSLFRDSLSSFFRQADKMSAREGEAVISPLLDLAAAAINGQVDEEGAAGVNIARFASVRRYVEENLLDRALSLETVMGAFGMSRRTAYRLFETVGGFSTYVSRRRLQRSLRMLRSAEWRHVSISSIGEAHGFSNAENFSRAFRREFGLSPREIRHLASTGNGVPDFASSLSETGWSHWVSAIGR